MIMILPNEADSSSNDMFIQEIESWGSFADILREEDEELFSLILSDCYKRKRAINAKELFRTESLLMALILQQHKLIDGLLSIIQTLLLVPTLKYNS